MSIEKKICFGSSFEKISFFGLTYPWGGGGGGMTWCSKKIYWPHAIFNILGPPCVSLLWNLYLVKWKNSQLSCWPTQFVTDRMRGVTKLRVDDSKVAHIAYPLPGHITWLIIRYYKIQLWWKKSFDGVMVMCDLFNLMGPWFKSELFPFYYLCFWQKFIILHSSLLN